jgi:putative thioredoxin
VESPDIISADDNNFDLMVLEYSSHIPVVVEFWAKWHLECQRVSDVLEDLAVRHTGRFRLARVNVDSNPRLTKGYQVHTVPTIKTFDNGHVAGQLEGSHTDPQIESFLKRFIPSPEDLLIAKATSYLRDAQYLSVEETCLEILEENPENPGAKLLLAKSLLWQGNYLESLTILQGFPASREYRSAEKLLPLAEGLLAPSGLEQDGEPLEAIYRRALTLIKENQIPSALDGLLETIKQDKNFRKGNPHKMILGIFELLGEEHPVTEEYRSLLANALF